MTDHDRLFKELLTTFFVEFLELFLPEVAAYLDPESLVALDKEIFTDVTLGPCYETDVLMQAKFKELDTWFLVHLEHQAHTEADFDKRMFRYFARLHEKHDKPVYPIVLFSYATPLREEPNSYRVAFPDLTVLEFNYRVIQLNRLNWRDYLRQPNPVASALMAKMNIAPQDRVRVKLECLRMLVDLKLTPAKIQLISGFVGTYLQLNTQEETEFEAGVETIMPEKKEGVMEIMTDWTIRGMAKGRVEGKSLVLQRMLNHRLGQLEPDLEARLRELTSEQLDDLSLALFDFTTIADLVSWLDGLK